MITNRSHGQVEGVYGQAQVWTPQISARQRWLWSVSSAWRSEIVRRYVGAEVASFDAPSTSAVEQITDAYRARQLTESVQATRSYGLAHKADIAVGAEVNLRHYHPIESIARDSIIHEDYRRLRLPTSDTRVGPWLQLRLYESRFHRVYDLDTLSLGEDYRLGYDGWVRAYPVTRALGSTRDFLGGDAFVQYAARVGDGLARVRGEALIEMTLPDSRLDTVTYAGNATLYGPRTFFGRLVADGFVLARPRNYVNQRTTVGGESRLRAHPSGALIGENVVAFSTEVRSRPLRIWNSQLGGALFYDVADAFDTWPPRPKSAVGFGLRAVLPQLDRNVIRLDIGFPLVRAEGAGPIGFYLAVEQAFGAKGVDPPNGLIYRESAAGALGQ